jgi:hypothetical protein
MSGEELSMHAFGAAIDVNDLINPYFDAVKSVMIPARDADRERDRSAIIKALKEELHLPQSEIDSILDVVIQPEGSDDRFLNRSIVRKGMLTEKEYEIFRLNGFNIWGGGWRQPIDYMHFQCSRELIMRMLQATEEKASYIWEEHLDAMRSNPCGI